MKDVFVCDQVRAENKNIHYLSFLETTAGRPETA